MTEQHDRTELQEAAKRVRVARTMAAAWPDEEHAAELARAMSRFKQLLDDTNRAVRQ